MKVVGLFKKTYVLYISRMAKSKFEYVREFESDDKLLPNCWIVVRVDGRGFHKFSKKHNFEKPNDSKALSLMNRAAMQVMEEFKDILIGYGQSDEYSFVLRKDTQIFNRRASKLSSYINSLFTSAYVFFWSKVFKDTRLRYPPAFDSRIILYPTDQNLKDYLSWRQADCHINNLYNTTFWNLIQKGALNAAEAEQRLSGTLSSDKNEILFSAFGINYNNEPAMYKRGTTLLRKKITDPNSAKTKNILFPLHDDIIQDTFWTEHTELLKIESAGTYNWPSDKPLPDLVLEQLRTKDTVIK